VIPAGDAISARYVRLAFDFEKRFGGVVDSAFGPARRIGGSAGRARCERELQRECEDLLAEAVASTALRGARRDFIAAQLQALLDRAKRCGEEELSLSEEAKARFDVEPHWIDAAFFADQAAIVKDCLPRTGTAPVDALRAFRAKAEIAPPVRGRVIAQAVSFLGAEAQARLDLVSAGTIRLRRRAAAPWRAYHRYEGNLASVLQVSDLQPLDPAAILHLLSHELFPGHHTELACKDVALVQARGWTEHALTLLQTPACVVSEGLAECGLTLVHDRSALIGWCGERLAETGLDPGEAEARIAIEDACQQLRYVAGNLALMLDARASDAEAAAYACETALLDREGAYRLLGFVRSARAHVFSYFEGSRLVRAFLDGLPDRVAGFRKLLFEPFTPALLREATAREALHA